MDLSSVLAFWGVSALLVVTPGADWAYAVAAGLGRHRVLAAVSGMLAGHLAATAAVAAGVAAVIAASPPAMNVLTLAGALYLVRLGIGAVRTPSAPGSGQGPDPVVRAGGFAKGVGVSLLNPKVFLLFLALLPQFTDPGSAWPVAVQMITLGSVHVANCALVYFAVAYGAAVVLLDRPRAARGVGVVSGVVMVALGLTLAGELLWSAW